ncbi:MAG: DUF6327 family protein [Flavobacterium sp.]
MKTTRYASYAEIDRDLEILQLEREIQKQKIGLEIQNTKSLFTPSYLFGEGIKFTTSSFSFNQSTLFKWVIPLIIKYIFTKKRG